MDSLEQALEAWMAAEKARNDWSQRYFVAMWGDDVSTATGGGEVLTREALEESKRLDEAVHAARAAYEARWGS
jgi:hypothetical protein